jgi:hypothetical protein
MTQPNGASPPPMIVPGPDGIVDFTRPALPVRFRVDDDVFSLLPSLPALQMLEFAELQDAQARDEIPAGDMFRKIFQLVLTEDSAALFIARMSDRVKPISVEQVSDIMPWIMEQYGMRPIPPSSSSSDISSIPESGANSTANAQPTASTSGLYPSLVSSTSPTGGSASG